MHDALGTLIDRAREEARKKLASGEEPLMLVTSNAYDEVRVFDAWKLIDKTVSTPGGVVEAMRHTLLDRPDLAPDVVLICSPSRDNGPSLEFLGDHVDDPCSIRVVLPYVIREGRPIFRPSSTTEASEERLLPSR